MLAKSSDIGMMGRRLGGILTPGITIVFVLVTVFNSLEGLGFRCVFSIVRSSAYLFWYLMHFITQNDAILGSQNPRFSCCKKRKIWLFVAISF